LGITGFAGLAGISLAAVSSPEFIAGFDSDVCCGAPSATGGFGFITGRAITGFTGLDDGGSAGDETGSADVDAVDGGDVG